MAQIDYYFATISPFTYLAGTRLEAIAAKHGASITYKPLDVVALFGRTGGQAPKDRHESRKAYRLQEMRRQAVKAALPLTLQPKFWPANPAPSSYAIIAAQAAGGGDPGGLVHAITRACWAEEKNIAEDDVIREALEGAGFDPALTDTPHPTCRAMARVEPRDPARNQPRRTVRNLSTSAFVVDQDVTRRQRPSAPAA